METIKQDIEEMSVIQEQLKSEQLEKIDFDKLILQLEKINSLYENYQHISKEFQQLQENLVQKIAVMKKATQVVTKKRPNIKELESELNELTSMNSLELLRLFEKTETKFHAAFPSTFRLENNQMKKLEDYKSYK